MSIFSYAFRHTRSQLFESGSAYCSTEIAEHAIQATVSEPLNHRGQIDQLSYINRV